MTRRRPLFAILLLCACAGEQPTDTHAPPPPPEPPLRISPGDTVSAVLGTPDSPKRRFTFVTPQGMWVALFVEVTGPAAEVFISDSASGSVLAPPLLIQGSPAPAMLRYRSAVFQAPGGGPGLILAQPYDPSSPPTSIRLLVTLIDRAPEHSPVAMAIDDTVSGEALDHSADVDEFTFQGTMGALMVVYGQGLGGQPVPAIEVTVIDPSSGTALGTSTSPLDAASLEPQASPRFSLPRSSPYRVVVSSATQQIPDGTDRGWPYRLMVRRIDPAPEELPSGFQVGDTVESSIDYPGDLDQYDFPALADQEFNLFVQRLGSLPGHVAVSVARVSDGYGLAVGDFGVASDLYDLATGRFTAPSDETYRLEITGLTPAVGADGGAPYRFRLLAIDQSPESAPSTIGIGMPGIMEAIDFPGDIDTFRLEVAEIDNLNFHLQQVTGAGRLFLQVLGRTNTVRIEGELQPSGGPGDLLTQPFLLPAGTYRVMVSGESWSGGYTGSYLLSVSSVSPDPESVSPAIAIGDTVSGESIDVPGDRDIFTFTSVRGDPLDLLLQGLASPSTGSGSFVASLFDPEGRAFKWVWTSLSSPTLDTYRTGLFFLPSTGQYSVVVGPDGGGTRPDEIGPYRLALVRRDIAPEQTPATLALGDSIGSETIGSTEDVDEFTTAIPAGTETQVYVHSPGGPVRVEVWNPGIPDTIATTATAQYHASTRRFFAPATGEIRMRVLGQPSPYSLWIRAINRSPESVSPNVPVGELVQGESIDVWGDIDEFTLDVTGGVTLTTYLRQTEPPMAVEDGLKLEIFAPGSTTPLAEVVSTGSQPIGTEGTGPVVLPVPGQYRIRVAHTAGGFGYGGYEFLVE